LYQTLAICLGIASVGFLSGPPPSGVDFQVPSDSLAGTAWRRRDSIGLPTGGLLPKLAGKLYS